MSVRIDNGLFYTKKEYEKRRAEVLSNPLPGGPLIDDIKFFLQKSVFELKYNLFMFALEERFPTAYERLTSLGLPKPY